MLQSRKKRDQPHLPRLFLILQIRRSRGPQCAPVQRRFVFHLFPSSLPLISCFPFSRYALIARFFFQRFSSFPFQHIWEQGWRIKGIAMVPARDSPLRCGLLHGNRDQEPEVRLLLVLVGPVHGGGGWQRCGRGGEDWAQASCLHRARLLTQLARSTRSPARHPLSSTGSPRKVRVSQ